MGLLTVNEQALMSSGYAKTGQSWWTMSPSFYSGLLPNIDVTNTDGTNNFQVKVGTSNGVRPVITLKPGITVTGSGTYSNPYKVNTSNS